MTTIKSQLTVAQHHATNFSEKGSNLTTVGDVSKDEETTVAGNARAHEVLELAKTAREQISEMISTASTNISSAAEGFEAVDQKQAAGIQEL